MNLKNAQYLPGNLGAVISIETVYSIPGLMISSMTWEVAPRSSPLV
jgi:hypothetical protein